MIELFLIATVQYILYNMIGIKKQLRSVVRSEKQNHVNRSAGSIGAVGRRVAAVGVKGLSGGARTLRDPTRGAPNATVCGSWYVTCASATADPTAVRPT